MQRLLPVAARAATRSLTGRSALRSAIGGQSRIAYSSAPAAAPSDHMEVFVDGDSVQVPKGVTVLQACEAAGIDIPRFCYHQRLSIAGNCRMCLVEVEKSPKPVASCAMPAMPGMKIKTGTPLVKKAREGVMEFLLLNHPLDCPICDQGGECDLQDQSMIYGSDRGRFTEYKRSVVDKNLGPLVKTVMTRCIHCTRCVRFSAEVAGVEDLGMTGRGTNSEIGTYVERLMSSELSGNVIDLCPVGALTSKPYAFTARNWELKSTESVDVLDALGSNIRIDSRGSEVMRILPRLNENVNEEWISDKTRFAYDGLKRQRLTAPMVKTEGSLAPTTWPKALEAIADKLKGLKGDEMMAVAGKLADAEAIIALKDFMNRLGSGRLACEGDAPDVEADVRSSYLANTGISRMEDADLLLLVGTDPRTEAPVLNARLRKASVYGNLKVAHIGPDLKLTYPSEHLGTDVNTLIEVAEGRHPFCTKLASAKRPMIIVGTSVMKRTDRDTVLSALHEITEHAGVVRDDWNGYNVLHVSAGRVAGLDLGFLPGPQAAVTKTPVKFLYLLGADDFDLSTISDDAFVVYQGHHGDRGAHRADVILPAAAYTEKEGTYVNTEGRVQRTKAAVSIVGDSRDDWKIIRALSEIAGVKLPYDTVAGIRARLAEIAPHLARVDAVEQPLWLNGDALAHHPKGEFSDAPFDRAFSNFYMTDAISRASRTMAKCVAAREAEKKRAEHGTGIPAGVKAL
eukprot:jgi/Chlat1/5561/Chrsp369S05353